MVDGFVGGGGDDARAKRTEHISGMGCPRFDSGMHGNFISEGMQVE